MGLLIEGKWSEAWYETKKSDGRFVRKESSFRDWVRADGSTRFAPEAGRYHLYVSLACPWAHRTLIFRKLKKLEDAISVSVVDAHMGAEGWAFSEAPGAIPDDVNHARWLREIYVLADPQYTGRVTVPVLWDREHETIVSNESAEIIRMFNSEFDALGDASLDLHPEPLRAQIDEINDYVYPRINNGVYRCGFATTQSAYEEAFLELFEGLDALDERLATQRYLLGDRITEADWRLFTTLVRFDPVYVGHFKCNRQRISDYAHLSGYLRELYQWPGVAETVDFEHIKQHYYGSHATINPSAVVPLGPSLDLDAPHERAAL
jgi:putative glutathione S-transferase